MDLKRSGTGGGGEAISRDATLPLPQTLFLPRVTGNADSGITAFTLLAMMLWHAWETMKLDPSRRHRMAIGMVRDYVFPRSHHESTDLVWKVVDELVAAGFVEMETGDGSVAAPAKGTPVFRLLQPPKSSPVRQSEIEFVLTTDGHKEFGLVGDGEKFINFPLDILLHVKTIHATRLCLLLLRYSGRKSHWFDISPAGLCDAVGLPDDSAYRRNFSQLKNNLILPAMDALNECGGVHAEFRPVPQGHRLKVRMIHFAATRRVEQKKGHTLWYEGPGFVTVTEAEARELCRLDRIDSRTD